MKTVLHIGTASGGVTPPPVLEREDAPTQSSSVEKAVLYGPEGIINTVDAFNNLGMFGDVVVALVTSIYTFDKAITPQIVAISGVSYANAAGVFKYQNRLIQLVTSISVQVRSTLIRLAEAPNVHIERGEMELEGEIRMTGDATSGDVFAGNWTLDQMGMSTTITAQSILTTPLYFQSVVSPQDTRSFLVPVYDPLDYASFDYSAFDSPEVASYNVLVPVNLTGDLHVTYSQRWDASGMSGVLAITESGLNPSFSVVNIFAQAYYE